MRNLKTVCCPLSSDRPPKFSQQSPLSQPVNFAGSQQFATTLHHDTVNNNNSIYFIPLTSLRYFKNEHGLPSTPCFAYFASDFQNFSIH